MTNLNKTVKNVLVIGLLGMTLTSCYKGKYKDQLRLNEELTQVNMGLESKITNLEDAVDIAQFKIEENAILIDGLEGDNSELSAENAKLGDIIILLNTEIIALKAALEASNGNSADLNDQLIAKTADLNVAITKINDLSSVVDGLNAEINRLNDIIAELQAANASYVSQVSNLNSVINNLNVVIDEHGDQIASYITLIQFLNTQLADIVPTDTSSYTTEIARLDLALSDANIMIDALNADVEDATAETARVQAELDALDAQVDAFIANVLSQITDVSFDGGNAYERAAIADGITYVNETIISSGISFVPGIQIVTLTIMSQDNSPAIGGQFVPTPNGIYDSSVDFTQRVRVIFRNRFDATLFFAGTQTGTVFSPFAAINAGGIVQN